MLQISSPDTKLLFMMNDITKAGLLFNAASIPCNLFMKLCDEHEPSEIFSSSGFLSELGLTEAQILRVNDFLAKDGWIEREMDTAQKFGARFITAKDLDYPVKLFDLKRPPVGLYVKGKMILSFPSVAIVGTRTPSQYGQDTASQLAKAIAKSGGITVSGGAQGIDSAAHRGSLSEDGITIAVFGTSIDRVYPAENKDLFARIAERGAVVSEYPIGSPGEAWHFPERNRLIAGMSSRTVIVEADEKSGAMITARYAEELGRELWAVPGRICDENSAGTNRLLNRGARCLCDVREFAENFTGRREQLELFSEEETEPEQEVVQEQGAVQEKKAVNAEPELSDDEKVIYALIQKNGHRLLDELIAESGKEIGDVVSAIVMLQAEGLVVEAGGRYSATN